MTEQGQIDALETACADAGSGGVGMPPTQQYDGRMTTARHWHARAVLWWVRQATEKRE